MDLIPYLLMWLDSKKFYSVGSWDQLVDFRELAFQWHEFHQVALVAKLLLLESQFGLIVNKGGGGGFFSIAAFQQYFYSSTFQ
jgi:hypothetical protein